MVVPPPDVYVPDRDDEATRLLNVEIVQGELGSILSGVLSRLTAVEQRTGIVNVDQAPAEPAAAAAEFVIRQ